MDANENKDGIDLTDIDAVKAALTDRARRFYEEYVIDLDRVRALKAAGYKHSNEKSARAEASRMLASVNGSTYVNYLQNNLVEATGITRIRIVNEYKRYLPKSADGQPIDSKDHLAALKGLRDITGADAPKQTKTELTGKDGESIDFTGAVIVIPERAKPKTLDEEQEGKPPLDTKLSDL